MHFLVAIGIAVALAIAARSRKVIDIYRKQVTAYRRGVPSTITVVLADERDGRQYFLAEGAAHALQAMRKAAYPVLLRVESAFRTMEEQSAFYSMSPEERAARGIGATVATPGWSNHQSGIAVDFRLRDDPRVLVWLRDHAARYGWHNTVPSEPWHWEWRA
jgi:LAS superfamily LD-carboxypeptidase LdcB